MSQRTVSSFAPHIPALHCVIVHVLLVHVPYTKCFVAVHTVLTETVSLSGCGNI